MGDQGVAEKGKGMATCQRGSRAFTGSCLLVSSEALSGEIVLYLLGDVAGSVCSRLATM